MKIFRALPCLVALSATALRAGPVETAIVAAMKLPDAPNYHWQTDVTDDARSYAITGETDRATDLSLVTMPMAASTAGSRGGGGRGGRGRTGSPDTVTAVFKGTDKFLVQDGENWRRPDEVAASSDRSGWGGRGGFGGPGRGRGMRGGARGDPRGEEATGRGNLQSALSRPHEEIAIIVSGASDMKEEGGVISGRLSETAAKLLLVHDGQKDLTPLQAGGTFRLWVQNGALVKYETKLEGVVRSESGAGRGDHPVHQTAVTTISSVGTTKVEVPDAARRKLGS